MPLNVLKAGRTFFFPVMDLAENEIISKNYIIIIKVTIYGTPKK